MINSIIVFSASYLYLFIVLIALIATLFENKTTRINILKFTVFTTFLDFIIVMIVSKLFYNPRPFVVEHITPLIPHVADNGFPSDHTLLVISIASILFVYNRRLGIFLFILGVLVGFARVYARVHHPIDIIGGIAVAVIATHTSFMILNSRLFSSKRQYDLEGGERHV